MRDKSYRSGFTLIELMVALIVSSVILAAVATLAFAMSSASDATDDTDSKQAQVRYATLRISELIRHCKLVWDTTSSDITIWKADDDGDSKIDSDELMYIQAGQSWDYIQIRKPNTNPVVLIPQCSNVKFSLDVPETPPLSKFVGISFDLAENNIIHHYQINSALRAWAGNLLNEEGTSIVGDDD